MNEKSIGILAAIILAIVIMIYAATNQSNNLPPHHGATCIIEQKILRIDTIEVIDEDGVRWYTLDTIYTKK